MIKKMYIGLHVKYPLFLSDFNENLNFSIDFRKMLKYQIPRKSLQCKPSCCMQTDGQINMEKIHYSQSLFARLRKRLYVGISLLE